MKIGLITSGGDCQGLNAALRGVAKTLFASVADLQLYGIKDGYKGLIEGIWQKMTPNDFSGILREGGTILGTSRQPFKTMDEQDETGETKLSKIIANYKKENFDALVILGGNGTHKTAHALCEAGVNVVTLPKTIDNDIFGTDYSFGFDSAVAQAARYLDSVHTTAASHGRIFVVELMGHKVGWITLYAGLAGGADAILLPELPYELENVVGVIERRARVGKYFSIIAIAEGALSKEQAALTKKERKKIDVAAGANLVNNLSARTDREVRLLVPGHFQRGGEPTATDRVLCLRLG
ncbi:MAG: 6-phosphofructokinase, partial [Oscillospiraceae bacterium]|nr:6-phosphofructokinase [Oscillospiraceae bacterium]